MEVVYIQNLGSLLSTFRALRKVVCTASKSTVGTKPWRRSLTIQLVGSIGSDTANLLLLPSLNQREETFLCKATRENCFSIKYQRPEIMHCQKALAQNRSEPPSLCGRRNNESVGSAVFTRTSWVNSSRNKSIYLIDQNQVVSAEQRVLGCTRSSEGSHEQKYELQHFFEVAEFKFALAYTKHNNTKPQWKSWSRSWFH